MKTRLVNEFKGSWIDYPSNDGICLSLYFTGCQGLCQNCQNKELQDPNYGTEFEISKLINTISHEAKRLRTNKITLLGGDPLFHTNINFVRELLCRTHKKFDYCLYTGYDVNFVFTNDIRYFKFLKTGLYDETLSQQSLKTDSYFQLASKNQKIYDENFKQISTDGILYFKKVKE